MNPGDAFYAVVVFSEAVQYNIANDDTAQPALFAIANNISIRFRVVASIAKGNAFRNESAKPFSEYGDQFICKMTADSTGSAFLHIDTATADLAGNQIEESIHAPPFATSPKPTTQEPTTQEEEYRAYYTELYPDLSEEILGLMAQYRIEEQRLSDAEMNGDISLDKYFAKLDELYEKIFGISGRYIRMLEDFYFEGRPEERYITVNGEKRFRVPSSDIIIKSSGRKPNPLGLGGMPASFLTTPFRQVFV